MSGSGRRPRSLRHPRSRKPSGAAAIESAVRTRRMVILLEAANFLAGASNALVMIVIPWLILERTGSAAAAGAAGALTAIPGLFVAPIVGTLVDRLGRKTVSVGSDVLSAVSVALFPIAERLGVLDLAVILGLTLLGAVFDPAGVTARKTLIPDVAAGSRVGVAQLNGVHEGLYAAGWVIGPLVGAAAIATIGPVEAMWIVCAAFLVAAWAVAALGVANKPRTDGGHADPLDSSFGRTIVVGAKALWSDRPVLIFTGAVAVLALLYMPTESVLLPVYFQGQDRPEAFGAVVAAMSVGGVAGAFGYGWLARHWSRYTIARVCMTTACLAYVPLAALLPLPWMVTTALFLGLAWGPVEPLLNHLVQDRFPPQQHGRVFGLQMSLFYAAMPLGQLVVGVAVSGAGVAVIFLVLAALLVVTALVVDFVPTLRGLDDPVEASTAQ